MEVAMNKCVSGTEILSPFRRFESLHLAFSTSCRPMRVLRANVQIAALSMPNRRRQLTLRHSGFSLTLQAGP
jgi:hypothetical protein